VLLADRVECSANTERVHGIAAAAAATAAADTQADSKKLAKAEKAKARGNEAFKQSKYR
jgi:hypothetical protein